MTRMGDALGWPELFDTTKSEWDSISPFLSVAQSLAGSANNILDVGCGRGSVADHADGPLFHDLRGPGRTVVGIDVDEAAAANPIVDEFRLIPVEGRWPVADASMDLAVSDWVLEHVDDPPAFVAELARVLRPGGVFVGRTVNRRSPMALASRSIPNDKHSGLLSRLQPRRQARDVFPTRYRMNTARDLRAVFEPTFECNVLHRAGTEQYLLRWPRVARSVMAIEPRLPKAVQMTLVVYARRR